MRGNHVSETASIAFIPLHFWADGGLLKYVARE